MTLLGPADSRRQGLVVERRRRARRGLKVAGQRQARAQGRDPDVDAAEPQRAARRERAPAALGRDPAVARQGLPERLVAGLLRPGPGDDLRQIRGLRRFGEALGRVEWRAPGGQLGIPGRRPGAPEIGKEAQQTAAERDLEPGQPSGVLSG